MVTKNCTCFFQFQTTVLSFHTSFCSIRRKKTLLIILLSKTPRARICLGTIMFHSILICIPISFVKISNFFLFFFRYFREGLQTIEHFGSYIEDLLNKMSIIRQNQFEEKRDLEEVRNVLKTSPGFNKMVIFYLNFHQKIMYYFQP